jgi:hypothetical protein
LSARRRSPVEELAGPRLGRLAEDPVGRALLEDPAGIEEADPAGDVAGEAHLVRR